MMLVAADSPGIDVRPVISIDGGHSLNEVFFDDVEVPAENLVGEVNAGWSYAKFLLDHERAVSAEVPRNKHMFRQLLAVAGEPVDGQPPLLENPVFAARVAEAEVRLAALEFMTLRLLSEQPQASAQWSAGPVLHIRGSELQQQLGELMVEALQHWGSIHYEEYYDQPPQDYPPGPDYAHGLMADFLYRRATTIYGGSNEIQRSLVAKNLLGRF